MGDVPPQPLNPTSSPFNLTDVDRHVLSQTDDEFVYHDWADLKSIIGPSPPRSHFPLKENQGIPRR